MGDDTQTQEQTQNSTTAPWARAQPLLDRLVGQYGGMSTDVTPTQSAAIDNMRRTLTNMPDFSSIMRGGADRLMNFSTNPQIDQWNGAYNTLNANLGATARGDFLDPMKTPGMRGWIDTLGSDITDRVKGVYAGSGRDPSGAGSFAGSLARGLSEGISPVVAQEADRLRQNQMSAANSLFSAGGNTAQGTAGLLGQSNDAFLKGLGIYGQLPGMATQNASGLLDLANAEAGLPWQNLERLLGGGTSLGAMGSTSTGSGTTTRTQPQSLMSNILGGISGSATLLPLLFSDENLKEDIVEVGGFKAVDYGKATQAARGILDEYLEAA